MSLCGCCCRHHHRLLLLFFILVLLCYYFILLLSLSLYRYNIYIIYFCIAYCCFQIKKSKYLKNWVIYVNFAESRFKGSFSSFQVFSHSFSLYVFFSLPLSKFVYLGIISSVSFFLFRFFDCLLTLSFKFVLRLSFFLFRVHFFRIINNLYLKIKFELNIKKREIQKKQEVLVLPFDILLCLNSSFQ